MEKKCLDCSKSFIAKNHRTGRPSHRKYCDGCLSLRFSVNSRKRQENHYIDKQGYSWIRIDKNFTQEHRYVMEQKLGRPLKKGIESVHHINGIRHDNNPDNLELWVGPIRYGQRAADIKCHNCGHSYKVN